MARAWWEVSELGQCSCTCGPGHIQAVTRPSPSSRAWGPSPTSTVLMGKLRLPCDPASLRMPHPCLVPVGPSVTGSLSSSCRAEAVTTRSCGTPPSTRSAWTPSPPSASGCVSPQRLLAGRAVGKPAGPTSSPGLSLPYALMPAALPSLTLLPATLPPTHRPDQQGSLHGGPGCTPGGPRVPGIPGGYVRVCDREWANPTRLLGGPADKRRAPGVMWPPRGQREAAIPGAAHRRWASLGCHAEWKGTPGRPPAAPWGPSLQQAGAYGALGVLPSPSLPLQERQRKYLSLSPWDKATLSMVSSLLCAQLGHTRTSDSGPPKTSALGPVWRSPRDPTHPSQALPGVAMGPRTRVPSPPGQLVR